MKAANIYLQFNGNCSNAFDFYRSVFGGEFIDKSHYSDMPSESPDSAAKSGLIMHVSLPLGECNLLMGCDIPPSFEYIPGNNYHVSLHTHSKAEADKVFTALSSGGKVIMPLADTFWGSYFGMAADKFGIQWMVSYKAD